MGDVKLGETVFPIFLVLQKVLLTDLIFFTLKWNPDLFPLFSQSGFKTVRMIGCWNVTFQTTKMIGLNYKVTQKVLKYENMASRVVHHGSGNGLNDRWMATLLASISGKLIPEELPEEHKFPPGF